MSAGLIDSRVDSSIFGTSKFVKEEDYEKENIYSNIDDMISDTLVNEKSSLNVSDLDKNADEVAENNNENNNDQRKLIKN